MESVSVLQVVGTSLAIPYQVLPLAQGLREQGYIVHVASPKGKEVQQVRKLGFKHIPFQMDRRLVSLTHLATIWQLAKAIHNGSYNIIHLHGPITGLLGRLAAMRSGSKSVVHCRGATFFDEVVDVPFAGAVRVIYPLLERMMRRATDLMFTL